MSSSFDAEKELKQLLMDLVDGELSYVQQQHLAALLRDDPGLQAKYREYLLLDSLLHWEEPAAMPFPSPHSSRRWWRLSRTA